MKTKFWTGYLLATLFLLSGVYFITAQISDVPFVLSDTQMEQLSGSLLDWECTEMAPCINGIAPCHNNTLMEIEGYTGCYTCETAPNLTCYYEDKDNRGLSHCRTCVVRYFRKTCETKNQIGAQVTSYKPCSSA